LQTILAPPSSKQSGHLRQILIVRIRKQHSPASNRPRGVAGWERIPSPGRSA
jgi:hypothetical protein